MNDAELNSMKNYLQKQISETPAILNDTLSYKNEKFKYITEFNNIKNLIDDFLNGENINRYIVRPGLRGVGKTTILYQIYEYLLKTKNINQNQLLYISCDQVNKITQCDIFKTVEFYLKEFHHCSFKTLPQELFLLIDECHFDKDCLISGKLIYDETKKNIYDIYRIISSEIRI